MEEKEYFDPYKVLNLSEDASQKEVKNRYFSLSRAFHPDKQPMELFKESSLHFAKVEEAYKILSTPMRKYVFDKYGFEGIKVCNEKAKSFESLEEEFKDTLARLEETIESIDADETKVAEAKAELKLMQKRIRENVEFYHRKINEENVNMKFSKEVSFHQTINIEEIMNYHLKRTKHSIQARAQGMSPLVSFEDLSLGHMILLPQLKGMQHLFGVSVANYHKKMDSDVRFKYRFQRVCPEIKNLELSGDIDCGRRSQDATFGVGKSFGNDIGVVVRANVRSEGKTSISGTLNKRFADDMTWFTQSQFDGEGEFVTGINKEFGRFDAKLENSLQVSRDHVAVSHTLTKQFTKKLSGFTSLSTFFTPSPILQFKLGFSYRISAMSKISFSNQFSGKSNVWEFRFSRLGFKMRIPIALGNNINRYITIFSLGVTGALLYSNYLYEKYRKRTKKHLKKLERKHRSRISDGKRTLNATTGELSSEVNQRILTEIQRDGVIVLKALYGYGPNIISFYKNEIRKWGYTRCFKAPKPIQEIILEEAHDYSHLHEVIDLRVIVQQMVSHSTLKISLDQVANARGVFNPCYDDTMQPYLLLVVYMNGKIIIRLLKKRSEGLEYSKDYDEYVQELPVEGRYNVGALLSTVWA